MSDINPLELGRQLRKPTGELGLKVGENMNSSNNQIYDFVLSSMNIKDNCKILEIGFGNGKFVSKFFDINPMIHLSAIDFSEIMCSEAKIINKGFINDNKLVVKCEDSMDMSFPNDSFDFVVTINTIYFWDNFDKHLQSIKRVLRNKGKLIIGYRPKNVMINLQFAQDVFKLYNSDDLQILVERNGLKIVKEEKQSINRRSVDGSEIKSTDICLIVEKI
jgi:ubiquinone/menaquinone biosynthesis C-methylase UbiE